MTKDIITIEDITVGNRIFKIESQDGEDHKVVVATGLLFNSMPVLFSGCETHADPVSVVLVVGGDLDTSPTVIVGGSMADPAGAVVEFFNQPTSDETEAAIKAQIGLAFSLARARGVVDKKGKKAIMKWLYAPDGIPAPDTDMTAQVQRMKQEREALVGQYL